MTAWQPATEEQLIEAVAGAVQAETSLEITGRGSKRALGRPLQTDQGLALDALSGLTLYEPEELVLAAWAGTPLAEIEAALAAKRQQLAFEPADLGPLLGGPAGAGSLGGTIACNLSGPRRIKAGAARDHVLGIRAVSGRGELFKSGGRVVKNVTGYDLSKLMTGSFGTLAVLSEITIKVLPRPETTHTLRFAGLADTAAQALLSAALGSAHEVAAAAHLPAELSDTGSAATLLRLEGPGPSVLARQQALADALARYGPPEILDDAASPTVWQRVRDVVPFALRPELLVWRLSVAPSAGPAVVAAIREHSPAALAYYDWGGGLVWLGLAAGDDPPDADHGLVRAAVAAVGGHATLVRAPLEIRAAVPVFAPQPTALAALSARLKTSFDPLRILNPGRMYAGV